MAVIDRYTSPQFGSFARILLRARPEAIVEAAWILTHRPGEVRSVVTRSPIPSRRRSRRPARRTSPRILPGRLRVVEISGSYGKSTPLTVVRSYLCSISFFAGFPFSPRTHFQ